MILLVIIAPQLYTPTISSDFQVVSLSVEVFVKFYLSTEVSGVFLRRIARKTCKIPRNSKMFAGLLRFFFV